ncbi:MAG: ROK family protein [Rhodospirillales bacterium]|nr:ROK family protein [Rhodospirillales bacterium]
MKHQEKMDIQLDLDGIFPDGSARRTDLAKARIFLAIREQPNGLPVTRRNLTEGLSLRQATVSAMVAELIQDGLVLETEKATPAGKGRPEASLGIHPERIMAPVIQVISRRLRGMLLDLEGSRKVEHNTTLDEDQASPENISAAFREIAAGLVSHRPDGTKLTGIGISLPGIVDRPNLNWISAARWPRLAGVGFQALAEETGLPVRIERNRQAELRAILARCPEDRDGGVLYVSWGYGISSAFAHEGIVMASAMGGFGDLGHWMIDTESQEPCLCGQRGCLEAHAALWALMPEFRKAFPEISRHPDVLETLFRERDIAGIPGIERATRLFALSLHNLFKTFFPDRIIVTGYFALNPWIADEVKRLFLSNLPEYASGRVVLEFAGYSADDAAIGVATPFIQECLRPLLTARDARI